MQCSREAFLVMSSKEGRKKVTASDFKLEFKTPYVLEQERLKLEQETELDRKKRLREQVQHTKWTHGLALGLAIPHNIPKGQVVELKPAKPKSVVQHEQSTKSTEEKKDTT